MNIYNKKIIPVVFQERVGTIHSFNYPRKQGATSEVTFLLSRNWLENQLAAATYNLANFEVDGDQLLLDKLKGNKPSPIPQTMIHGDYTIDNVLVYKGLVSSFIDLSGCSYGDPRYDVALGIRAFLSDPVLLDAFYSGYEAKRMSNEEFTYFEEGLYEFF